MLIEGLGKRQGALGGRPGVWSYETDRQRHEMAVDFWEREKPENVDLRLVWGRLSDKLATTTDVKADRGFKEEMLQWWRGEEDSFRSAPLVTHTLPPSVDFVLLDGGEFSTQGDWECLKAQGCGFR